MGKNIIINLCVIINCVSKQQDKQCTYNVTMSLVLATIVAVVKQ